MSERQRNITYEQVMNKRYEARRRTDTWMRAALDAKDAETYDTCLYQMEKAVDDWKCWDIVVKSMRER